MSLALRISMYTPLPNWKNYPGLKTKRVSEILRKVFQSIFGLNRGVQLRSPCAKPAEATKVLFVTTSSPTTPFSSFFNGNYKGVQRKAVI